MIIRIMVIDPMPRPGGDEVVTYQVPERSRAFELLVEMLDSRGLEWVTVDLPKRRPPVKEVKS